MLSAVVIAADAAVPVVASPEAVVRTLTSLVPAAIEGIVRDLTLASYGDDGGLAKIADHAGCSLVRAQSADGVIAAGIAAARGDLLLIIRAGFAPQTGFIDEIADLFAGAATRPPGVFFRVEPETLLTRLSPSFSPVMGLIAARGNLSSKARDFRALVQGLGAVKTLRARLRRVD